MTESPQTETSNGSTAESGLVRSLRSFLRTFGLARGEEATLQENLRELIEQHPEAAEIDPEERALLLNLVKFGDLRVGDVMIPRADIVALEMRSSIEEVIDLFRREFHSRIPVYRESLDSVIGMIHIKDLLKYWSQTTEFSLESAMRDVLFVPPSMPVPDLLLKMRTRRVHMALVVDEYGGTDGLATIEDLVEAIVGDIEDEHDEDEISLITEAPDGRLEVDGRAETADVESRLGLDLLPSEQDEDIDTIAGVVAAIAGRVPQRGEVIAHTHGVEFEILQADARRIRKLRIKPADEPLST